MIEYERGILYVQRYHKWCLLPTSCKIFCNDFWIIVKVKIQSIRCCSNFKKMGPQEVGVKILTRTLREKHFLCIFLWDLGAWRNGYISKTVRPIIFGTVAWTNQATYPNFNCLLAITVWKFVININCKGGWLAPSNTVLPTKVIFTTNSSKILHTFYTIIIYQTSFTLYIEKQTLASPTL